MSSIQLDGSHTLSKRGGEAVAYQGRRKGKTSNILIITDSKDIPLSCSEPIEGNHNDSYELSKTVDKMLSDIVKSNIRIDGLFLNADAGFDTDSFRRFCNKKEIIDNIAVNPRDSTNSNDYIFDTELYKDRFVIERTNAWIDAFKALLIVTGKHCICWLS